jgi:hypothetical protein
MQRIGGTELPTFTCGPDEWRGRRAAGALATFERQHGHPPTLWEMGRALGVWPSTVSRWLVFAYQLGLVDRAPGSGAQDRRWFTVRAA